MFTSGIVTLDVTDSIQRMTQVIEKEDALDACAGIVVGVFFGTLIWLIILGVLVAVYY